MFNAELYHGETWELMVRRWAKLEKDFLNKNGVFDISKIPDIYDCIKYDLLHNSSIKIRAAVRIRPPMIPTRMMARGRDSETRQIRPSVMNRELKAEI